MRARILLLLSVGLNLVLAGTALWLARDKPEVAGEAVTETQTNTLAPGPRQIKTNTVVRRQLFAWSDIESPDYSTYVANLRKIGCPEKTIRDIVVADVNAQYAERIAREVVLPEQQWWKPDPQTEILQSAADQIRALEAEKEQLLAQLLGPNWKSDLPPPTADPIRLDGPVLGQLTPEIKAQLFEIEANSRRAVDALTKEAAEQGRGADSAALHRIQQDTRTRLAQILAPDQLEEYLLRYSAVAENMRSELRGFGADADEFRKIFRARDPFEQQLSALVTNDPASQGRRVELERLRDAAVQQAVGPERFQLYQLTQSPLFQNAQELAEQSGGTPENVLPIFQVNQAAQEEITRVQNDQELSEVERLTALKTIETQQQISIRQIISGNPPLPPDE